MELTLGTEVLGGFLKQIKKFINYKDNDHINKKKRFDPNKSIANTQVFLSKNIRNKYLFINYKL